MKEAGFVLFGIYVLLSIWLLVSGLIQFHLWRLSTKKKSIVNENKNTNFPFVTIQVPVYNEKYVIEGLLDSLAQLTYPKNKFEILVLDDSTDDSCGLIDRKKDQLKAQGCCVSVIRRPTRNGYKAGALQESLPICKGEFIAIFDADFRPSPSFLNNMIGSFANANVGLVQARWGHLNREQNFLTRIQSYLLDTYFSIEQSGRFKGDYFSNFCGTAGIWRKACIEEAGGWDGSVLSEDLDLSYRAQLKGWKLVYRNDVLVPGELPSTLNAFKIQQARWTKGIVQTLRKSGMAVLKAAIPLSKKWQALFHLSSSFVFPCLLINSLLSLPLLLLRHRYPEFIFLTNWAALGGLNLLLLTFLFYRGRRSTNDGQFWRNYPIFLLVYMGLSVQNTVSVFEGLVGKSSPFIRTPKFASNRAWDTTYCVQKVSFSRFLEWGLFFYFVSSIGISIHLTDYFFLLLFIMMSAGLGVLLFLTTNWRWVRQPFSLPRISWR